jgi:imidazolonepropionase-like amidohydrolase
VFPGLIDAGSHLGLAEILLEVATRDEGEIARIQPQLRTASAIHPFSEHIRAARCSGITTALAMPARGWLRGQSAVIDLAGWTFRDMARGEDFALHVALPVLPPGLTGDDREERIAEQAGQMREIHEFFTRAAHYAEVMGRPGDEQPRHERDLRLETMTPYLRGDRPVVFHAQSNKEIVESIDFAEKHGLRCVICGGREAWKCAAQLAEKQIPVIIAKVTSYPAGEYEPFDSVFACAALLDQAGVYFAFASDSAADAFNLPLDVGLAVANGLSPERAMHALTLGAAEILGIADEVGSLAPGKVANVIICSGLPIQASAAVTGLFIRGRPVELTSMHTENLEKFRRRPEPKLDPPVELVGPPSLTRRGE